MTHPLTDPAFLAAGLSDLTGAPLAGVLATLAGTSPLAVTIVLLVRQLGTADDLVDSRGERGSGRVSGRVVNGLVDPNGTGASLGDGRARTARPRLDRVDRVARSLGSSTIPLGQLSGLLTRTKPATKALTARQSGG
jgi:hypothetical protein